MISGQDRGAVPEASSLLDRVLGSVRPVRGVRWRHRTARGTEGGECDERPRGSGGHGAAGHQAPSLQPILLGSSGVVAGLAAILSPGRGDLRPQRDQRRLLRRGILLALARRMAARAGARARPGDPHDGTTRRLSVLSDPDGAILAQNAAAEARIGDDPPAHVAHAFAGFFPTHPPSSRARPPPCKPATARRKPS
jgi:hypothetical protein